MKTKLILYLVSLFIGVILWVGLIFYSLKLAMICFGMLFVSVFPFYVFKLMREPEIMESINLRRYWIISDDKRIAINPTEFLTCDGDFDSVAFNNYLLKLKIKDKFSLIY